MQIITSMKVDMKMLDELIVKEPQKVSQHIGKTAFKIQIDAVMMAPYKTGYLRSTIMAEEQSQFTWRVNVYADYGIYQELGTYKMSAHPYLVPSVEKNWQDFVNGFSGLL